jgi:AmmeMemoRadiSam system protein B
MQDVRPAAVAGMFYPKARHALAEGIRDYLARVPDAAGPSPKAVIVPHAGYIYSGPVAAAAYAQLAPMRETVRRVVLLGPTHRVAVRGLAVPAARAFETPLGAVPIDSDAVARALSLPQVMVSDPAHAQEHALEVQLPFLQTVLNDFSLVPFAVGQATPTQVAEVIDMLWGGPETLVVVSSDLSHYHPYAVSRHIDRATADTILALSPTLDHEQACGATPVNGLLECARRRGLTPALLDLRNSGDTAGDRSRVVGYASFAFVGPTGPSQGTDCAPSGGSERSERGGRSHHARAA